MWGTILGKLIEPVMDVVGKTVRDKDLVATLRHDISKIILEDGAKQLQTQADIIIAEAQGGSWLQRSWRPITMLFFVGLIGAHWLGFTAENLSEAEVLALLAIVQVGLGGYIFCRSAEKVADKLSRKGII